MENIVLQQIEDQVSIIEEERLCNNGNAFCYWSISQILFDKFEDNKDDMIFPESNDQGIDFFWINEESKIIYFGQSKKNQNIDHTVVNDLLKSVDFLEKEGRKNSQLLEEASIQFRDFIKNNEDYKIIFLYTTLGEFTKTANTAKDSHKDEDHEVWFFSGEDLTKKYNENIISLAGRGIDQIELMVDKNMCHKYVKKGSKVSNAIVAVINAKEIAKIFRKHGEGIFSLNVRRGLGFRNKVNTDMQNTLKDVEQRKYFYFYNNGICMVCKKIEEKVKDDKIKLILRNVNIVNGGQTTRQLCSCRDKLNNDVHILIKIFESENKDVINRIALYNNSQTAVTSSDLLSNDNLLIRLYSGCKLKNYYFERQKGLLNDEYKTAQDKKRAFGRDWKKKIIQPKELGQIYLAVMGLPYLARGKSKLVFEVDGTEAKFNYVFKNLDAKKAIFLWKIWLNINEKIKQTTGNADITDIKYGKWLVLQYLGLCLKEEVLRTNEEKDPDSISKNISVILDSKNREYEEYIKKDFDKEKIPEDEGDIDQFFKNSFSEALETVKDLFREEKRKREEEGKAFSYNDYVKSENAQRHLFREFYRAYTRDLRRNK